jgi:hypothetical protein
MKIRFSFLALAIFVSLPRESRAEPAAAGPIARD